MAQSFIRFKFGESDRDTDLHNPGKNLCICVNVQEYNEVTNRYDQKKDTYVCGWNGDMGMDARLSHRRRQ